VLLCVLLWSCRRCVVTKHSVHSVLFINNNGDDNDDDDHRYVISLSKERLDSMTVQFQHYLRGFSLKNGNIFSGFCRI